MLDQATGLTELSDIKVEDADLFWDAAQEASVKSYLYYFPMLHYYGQHKAHTLLWERHAGSIIVYLLRRRSSGTTLNLFLPPFPFDPVALRYALQRMRELRGDRSGRIIWVQQQEALLVAREGFEIHFKEDEFILDRAAVMALEGPGFRSLRQELSRARKPGLVETRPYRAADQPVCLALAEQWKERLRSMGMPADGYRTLISCLATAEHFPRSLLHGLVVEVNGEVRGFAFSGPITQTHGCNFIRISDPDYRGLTHLLAYRLMAEFPELVYFNDSTDNGRPGLRELKQRFRPVEMHGLFGARDR
jgi:hypothetical protein